jgi:beta-lactamase class A
VSEQRPSRTTYLVRRIAVLGVAALGLILILKIASSFSFTQTVDATITPIPNPVPVADPELECEAKTPVPQSFINDWELEFEAISYNATVIDLVENCTYKLGDSKIAFPSASTGKVLLAISVLEMVEAGTMNYENVESDMSAMIIQSDNEAANRLFAITGANSGVLKIIVEYNLNETTMGKSWGSIMTTSADQASLLNQSVGKEKSPLAEEQRVILRDLMRRVNPDQAWGAGSSEGLPDQWSVAVKNGWYFSVPGDRPPVGLWRINTLGYVWDENENPRWIFTGYSNAWKSQERGISAWNEITKQLSLTLGTR